MTTIDSEKRETMRWMIDVTRRLEAIEAKHHEMAVQLRRMADDLGYTINDNHKMRLRLREAADRLDGKAATQ